MRIALVTNYLPPHRLPLYRLLAERHGVEVFCFGGKGEYVPEALRDLDRQLAEASFPAHRLLRQRDAAALAERHDAVIAGTTGRVALPAAYVGARRARRPFVLWASLWAHPRTVAHMFSFPLMRRLYRRADAVVTYGPHVSRYAASRRGTEDGIFVAPQSVDGELFGRPVSADETAAWRREVDLPVAGPLVLFVGRLVPEKGVDLLLRAWQKVDPGLEASLCLVGDGPLRDAATAAGPPRAPRVRFAGRLPRERLPLAYASADVVAVPSVRTRRFLEPWGVVCNEAMHQARPVIATTAVGAAAGGLVRDGETGLVVEDGDVAALARAIERLLEDASLRERLGRQAKEAVAAYTHERGADGFRQALEAAGAAVS